MADEKMVTERDVVRRERAAFLAGVGWSEPMVPINAQHEARRRYPLPRIERPRVMADSRGTKWKLVNGTLWRQPTLSDWRRYDSPDLDVLASLIASPTELVDPDQSGGDETP